MVESPIYVESFDDIPERLPVFLAVGVFDGVHLGHQQLLAEMISAAEEVGCVPAILTFFPHPARVIRGKTGRYYLNRPAERVQNLTHLGIDLVIMKTFDDLFRQIPAYEFVQMLRKHLNLREIWGSDFSLGYQGKGDYAFLTEQGQQHDFKVQRMVVKAEIDDHAVSSSRIRQALAAGDVEQASRCLTRPFVLSGPVIYGSQRGRIIGFPTANIEIWDEQVVPANGVYACKIEVAGRTYLSATNVGVRPTVSGGGRLAVEAHILDFEGDIYGQEVKLSFLGHVRPEKKFNGLDELKAQIGRDVAFVRQTLSD